MFDADTKSQRDQTLMSCIYLSFLLVVILGAGFELHVVEDLVHENVRGVDTCNAKEAAARS